MWVGYNIYRDGMHGTWRRSIYWLKETLWALRLDMRSEYSVAYSKFHAHDLMMEAWLEGSRPSFLERVPRCGVGDDEVGGLFSPSYSFFLSFGTMYSVCT